MRPASSEKTCAPVVGLMRPKRFALGAASGRPKRSITARKTGCALIRTATVPSPAVTTSGTTARRGSTSVSGPGQKRLVSMATSARLSAGISASSSSQPGVGRCTISGSKNGRSFASKIFSTASGLSASAASPYTVSVGSATGSPDASTAAARVTAASKSSGVSLEKRTVSMFRPIMPSSPSPSFSSSGFEKEKENARSYFQRGAWLVSAFRACSARSAASPVVAPNATRCPIFRPARGSAFP